LALRFIFDINQIGPLYEIIAGYPAFQSVDECINKNNSILIGITMDADRDAPPFKAGTFYYYFTP